MAVSIMLFRLTETLLMFNQEILHHGMKTN